MMYRIYTEDTNRAGIEAIVAQHFTGFTIYTATGYWNGIRENSLVIEIVCSVYHYRLILLVASQIKAINKQESVMLLKFNEAEAEYV